MTRDLVKSTTPESCARIAVRLLLACGIDSQDPRHFDLVAEPGFGAVSL